MTAERRSFLFPAPNTPRRVTPNRVNRQMSALQQAPQAQHKQDTDGGFKRIMNHIIDLKQTAATDWLGQFYQHRNIAV